MLLLTNKWLPHQLTSCSTYWSRYVQPVKSDGFSLTDFQYFSNSLCSMSIMSLSVAFTSSTTKINTINWNWTNLIMMSNFQLDLHVWRLRLRSDDTYIRLCLKAGPVHSFKRHPAKKTWLGRCRPLRGRSVKPVRADYNTCVWRVD